jgi:hypothetical protein
MQEGLRARLARLNLVVLQIPGENSAPAIWNAKAKSFCSYIIPLLPLSALGVHLSNLEFHAPVQSNPKKVYLIQEVLLHDSMQIRP